MAYYAKGHEHLQPWCAPRKKGSKNVPSLLIDNMELPSFTDAPVIIRKPLSQIRYKQLTDDVVPQVPMHVRSFWSNIIHDRETSTPTSTSLTQTQSNQPQPSRSIELDVTRTVVAAISSQGAPGGSGSSSTTKRRHDNMQYEPHPMSSPKRHCK